MTLTDIITIGTKLELGYIDSTIDFHTTTRVTEVTDTGQAYVINLVDDGELIIEHQVACDIQAADDMPDAYTLTVNNARIWVLPPS